MNTVDPATPISPSTSPIPPHLATTSASPAGSLKPTHATTTSDLVDFINSQLTLLEQKFTEKSSLILEKIEHMGTRLGELEQSITELMDQSALPTNSTDLPPETSPTISTEKPAPE